MLDAALINLESGATIQAFEIVRCDLNDPMTGISQLSSEILGWWASRNDNVQSLPNYEGYLNYMDARSTWKIDLAKTERSLEKSIAADNTFIDPYFLLTQLYHDEVELERRDSMIEVIRNGFEEFTDRQRALLDGYEAEARGDLIATYKHYQVEVKADPYDVFVNTAGMIQAFQNVNKPEETIQLYNMIPIDSLDLEDCVYCQSRPRFATFAYLELDQFENAAIAASHIPLTSEKNILARILPDIVSNNTGEIKEQLLEAFNQGQMTNPFDFHTQIAWRLELAGNIESARTFCLEALSGANPGSAVIFEAHYILGDYDQAVAFIEKEWLPQYADNFYVLSFAARSYAHAGLSKELEQVIALINKADEKDDYSYGKYTYILAVVAAIEGRADEALSLLEKAFFEGAGFNTVDYKNDIDLISLFENPRFQRIIHPAAD